MLPFILIFAYVIIIMLCQIIFAHPVSGRTFMNLVEQLITLMKQ